MEKKEYKIDVEAINSMTLKQLERRVQFLEQVRERFVQRDKYLGKSSRSESVTQECNLLWRRIAELARKDYFREKKFVKSA